MIVAKSVGDKVFNAVNMFILGIVGLVFLVPLVYALVVSVEPYKAYVSDPMHLFPRGFTLQYYSSALTDPALIRAFANGILVTAGNVLLLLATTSLGAFVLSRKDMPGRKLISMIFIFPMFFSGGLIPTYLLYKDLHLVNSLFGLMLYGCTSTFWMLILKANMEDIPDSLAESARIDGAREAVVLRHVYLPLSRAPLACIGLMGGVWKWNEFFWAQIAMQDPKLYTFQVYLRNMFSRVSVSQRANLGMLGSQLQTTVGLQMAIVVIGIVPVLAAYPLIQKYFVSGMRIGAIKA
jgi:putative aldouronate transport system permease protein